MGTTPLWVPFALAVIAVVGTLAGVVSTQIWNSRQEERRWARENDRLREAQAREDLNRTYEHRRAAYVEFQQEIDRLTGLLHSNREPLALDDPAFGELAQRWTPIRVYGTYEADTLAFKCMDRLQDWGHHPDRGDLADDAYSVGVEYLFQIRKDLGVPEWKPAEPPDSKPATGQRFARLATLYGRTLTAKSRDQAVPIAHYKELMMGGRLQAGKTY